MKTIMIFALISAVAVFAISTVVAYIFFNILESSAEASLQNWKLGGAFAGFVFTASLLTSITFQFYKQITADQISDYRDQIQELQSKLVRGASCPEKYVIEVDEKSKLVFSRPEEWLHRGGILYDYGEMSEHGESRKTPHFMITASSLRSIADVYEAENLGPIDMTNVDVDKLYDDYVDRMFVGYPEEAKESMTKDITFVDGIRSLRVSVSHTEEPDPRAQKPEKEDEYRIRRCEILTYVPRLETFFSFRIFFNEKTYRKSSEEFENIIRSIRFLT